MAVCQTAQTGLVLKMLNIFNLKSKFSGGHIYAKINRWDPALKMDGTRLRLDIFDDGDTSSYLLL